MLFCIDSTVQATNTIGSHVYLQEARKAETMSLVMHVCIIIHDHGI